MATAAGNALSLIQEVSDLTDEQRRKKLLEAQQARLLPGTSAASAALGRISSGYSAALGGY